MYVRPHLEYGDIIFHDCAIYLMKMLESVQYQAGLIATGCWKNTNREKLYEELGWDSLSDRWHVGRLLMYKKIVTHDSPAYLSEYVLGESPPIRSTDRYRNSFFPYCFQKWNSLDPSLKCLDYNKLKSQLLETHRPKRCNTYWINDRYGLKLLTCIRVDHSDLRAHRFTKGFNCLTPTCRCGIEDESPAHFFLRCPFSQGPRIVLLNKVIEILECQLSDLDDDSTLTHLLLYGNPSLADCINKDIITASIKFIRTSKRFKRFEAFTRDTVS